MIAAPESLDHAHGDAFIADTGYDSNDSTQSSRPAASRPSSTPSPSASGRCPLDRKLYRIRYLVEVCFHEMKRFRAIGTRYDKTKASFLALLQVACICLWLN